MLGNSRKFVSFVSPICRRARSIHNSVPGIEKSDVLHYDKDRGISVVRLSPKHIPMLKPAVKTFIDQETTSTTFNVKVGEQHLWPVVYNCTRYPFSYCMLDKTGEIVNIGLSDVVYRNPMNDPRPRATMELEQDDPFLPLGAALDYSEQRMLELYPHQDKLLIGAISWTKKELRRKKVASLMSEHIYKPIIHDSTAAGFEIWMAMVTSIANREAFRKIGWEQLEPLPDHAYDVEGFERKKLPEGNALLFAMDLIKAKKKPQFQKNV